MTQRDFSEMVQDWWGFAAFLAGTVLAFWMGTKRREWQLQEAIKDIEELKQRMREAEREQRSEANSIAGITSALQSISENQRRILAAIDALQTGKADK